jgi:hypothetical protein
MLDNLKDELKPKDEKHLTKPQVGNLKDTLMNWETNEWKKIVDAGKTANAKNIGKYKPSAISSANTPGTQ